MMQHFIYVILVGRLSKNLAIEWFHCNYMKLNKDKCHLNISGHKSEAIWVKKQTSQIFASTAKLLAFFKNFKRHLKLKCDNGHPVLVPVSSVEDIYSK